jgi:hypothetical protein
MNTNYMMACGIVWRKTADPDAGWELVEALCCPDAGIRHFARNMLVERRNDAIALLEDGITAGVLTADIAGPCMVELLRGPESPSWFAVTGEA